MASNLGSQWDEPQGDQAFQVYAAHMYGLILSAYLKAKPEGFLYENGSRFYGCPGRSSRFCHIVLKPVFSAYSKTVLIAAVHHADAWNTILGSLFTKAEELGFNMAAPCHAQHLHMQRTSSYTQLAGYVAAL
jgi:hypothetical protein